MKLITVSDSATTYTRITKKQAYKAIASGLTIVACPHKLFPGLPWTPGVYVSEAQLKAGHVDLDRLLADIQWYNCSHEAGYYLSFYLTEDR